MDYKNSSREELIERINTLEVCLEQARKDKDFWYGERQKAEKKYRALAAAVGSIAELCSEK